MERKEPDTGSLHFRIYLTQSSKTGWTNLRAGSQKSGYHHRRKERVVPRRSHKADFGKIGHVLFLDLFLTRSVHLEIIHWALHWWFWKFLVGLLHFIIYIHIILSVYKVEKLWFFLVDSRIMITKDGCSSGISKRDDMFPWHPRLGHFSHFYQLLSPTSLNFHCW